MADRVRTTVLRFARLAALAAGACAAAATASCQSQGGARPPLVASTRCADVSFPVYFEEGSDQLTAAARQVIAARSRQAQGCRIMSAEVLGLADAPGAPAANLQLSQRRASVVAQALAAAGLPAPTFDIRAAGDATALTPNGRRRPLNRKAEVRLHAAAAA